MTSKKVFLRLFFILETGIFGYAYLFGTHGLRTMVDLRTENAAQERKIAALKKEIATLEIAYNTWQKYDFYREKIAREQLQMAHQDDEIYYLT